VLAAAVAFRVFLFAIPYIFVVVAVFDVSGTVADQDPRTVAQNAGIGGLLAQAVSASAAHLSGTSRFLALGAGLVAVFWAAWVLLKTLRIVHGLVWRVHLRKPARPALAVIVVIGLVTVSLLLSLGIEHLRSVSGLGGLGAIVLFTAVPGGIWLAVEFGLPHSSQVRWKDLIPGAILFGIAVLALHLFTVYWIAHLITRRSAVYGAIGVSLAILLWAYVVGRIMTASAVVNATLWARGHAPAATPAVPE
jgi:membrane protein